MVSDILEGINGEQYTWKGSLVTPKVDHQFLIILTYLDYLKIVIYFGLF